MAKRCPRCGRGKLFSAYIRPAGHCNRCQLDFRGHQADDAPPYLTTLFVGHVAIPLALVVKQVFDPPLGVQFAIWAPLTIGAALWLLPITKGALIGVQWANRMHGFGAEGAEGPAQP